MGFRSRLFEVWVFGGYLFGIGFFLMLGTARASDCDRLLTGSEIRATVSDQLLSRIDSVESGIDRLTIKSLRGRITRRVLSECRKSEGCLESEVEALVQSEVDRTLKGLMSLKKRLTLVKGYSIITFAMVGSAVMNHTLKGLITSESAWGWITELSGPLTLIGILKFGSPLWDSLSAISTTAAFRVRAGKGPVRNAPENSKLDRIYSEMMSDFTPTQLNARNALANAVGAVRTVSKDTIEIWLKGEHVRAADRMAELAIFSRKYLAEIRPETGSMVRVIHMVLVKHLGGEAAREEFARLMIRSIEDYETDLGLPGVREFYDRLARAWITENTGADTHH
ncbi:MAG: hypothetical protein EBX52_03760 [Proteobacteria bacterium]|nr:hypothetical protein [Pseudomonadota bacterium]